MRNHPGDAGRCHKVMIPRLKRDGNVTSERRGRKDGEGRVAKACTSCRRRKVKCSGTQPTCKNCSVNSTVCKYEAQRRDRLKSKDHRIDSLKSLLRELSLRADEIDRRRIRTALSQADDGSPISNRTSGKRRKSSAFEEDEHAEPVQGQSPASEESNENLSELDEDLSRSRESRETGFVGGSSDMNWLRSLEREMRSTDVGSVSHPYGHTAPGAGATDFSLDETTSKRLTSRIPTPKFNLESTYYLDSETIQLAARVNPRETPAPDAAERLMEVFLCTVNRSFPIVSDTFAEQFRRFNEGAKNGRPFQVPDNWLASLNLVFAIGARYSHLTNANWRGDNCDHVVYMTRAVRLLGAENSLLIISTPELELIKATGLLAFYWLVVGHVDRAWMTIGVAIRQALALGLHLRNKDASASTHKKEVDVRTWWGIHSIECILSGVTGRPCVLPYKDCTTAMPTALADEVDKVASSRWGGARPSLNRFSNSSSDSEPFRRVGAPGFYLNAHVNIGLITQKILSTLYAPRSATRTWEHLQKKMLRLSRELEDWKATAMPLDAHGQAYNPFQAPDRDREWLLIRFAYASARILITRPCLCRKNRNFASQSDGSSSFNRKSAQDCVRAARDMTLLLPEQPSPSDLYATGPWWSIVHSIVQALTVLLMELSYQRSHTSSHSNEIAPCVKKLVRHLRVMGLTDVVTSRAYEAMLNILRRSAAKFHDVASTLLAEHDQLLASGSYGGPIAPELKGLAPGPVWYNDSLADADSQASRGAAAAAHYEQFQALSAPSANDPNELSGMGSATSVFWNPLAMSFDQSASFNVPTDAAWESLVTGGQGQPSPFSAPGDMPYPPMAPAPYYRGH